MFVPELPNGKCCSLLYCYSRIAHIARPSLSLSLSLSLSQQLASRWLLLAVSHRPIPTPELPSSPRILPIEDGASVRNHPPHSFHPPPSLPNVFPRIDSYLSSRIPRRIVRVKTPRSRNANPRRTSWACRRLSRRVLPNFH